MGNEKDKEYYQLWWEHLRRHKVYREFCQWIREKSKNRNHPTPPEFRELELKGALEYLVDKYDVISKYPFVEETSSLYEEKWKLLFEVSEFQQQLKNHSVGPLFSAYLKHGDIFNIPFEKWYEAQRKLFRRRERLVVMPPVRDINEDIKGICDTIIEKFITEKGRNPEMNEIGEILARHFANEENHLFLKVDVNSQFGKIQKQVIDMVKKRKEQIINCFWLDNTTDEYQTKKGKKDYEYMRMCLEIHDLKYPPKEEKNSEEGIETKTIKEVISERGKGEDSTNADIQRQYYRNLKDAKSRIKSALAGTFPKKTTDTFN